MAEKDHEYALSSRFCRELDRLIFPEANISEACLALYPTKGTNRCDYAILLDSTFVLVGDYKKSNDEYSEAVKETKGYCMNITEVSASFQPILGLPCTPYKLGLHLYLPGNKKLACIIVEEVDATDTAAVKRLLCCIVGAVEWLKTKRISDVNAPACVRPQPSLLLQGCLDEKFRTFRHGDKVYKFFDNTSGLSNVELIKQLPGYDNVHEVQLSDDGRYSYLCYNFIQGSCSPKKIGDFRNIIETLQKIHEMEYVHGDVRLQNLVFGLSRSWIIDFDNALKVGAEYPVCYNSLLPERHSDIRISLIPIKCDFVHDWYSLSHIIRTSFGNSEHNINIIVALVSNIKTS